ncbi:ras guanyl-nucleotide exchange factor [Pyrenophora tritici-repentis]|nr:ras guanyl-nucleotide exchange factor [Pyrenophora tritici-repentis]
MQAPRRESSAGIAPQRPGLKTRAYSAPNVPRTDEAAASTQLSSTDEGCEGEEITDDAFFQRYHFPHQVPYPEEEDQGDSSAASSSDTEGPLSPTHAKDRQPAGDAASEPSTGSANSDSGAPAMQELNMAVIGARGSGRSTFIRRALGLPDAATTSNCSRTIAIDGSPYLVRFLEMMADDVHLTERCIIKWPETVHDSVTPRIDAAVILYDVTNSDSLGKVPDMLSILNKAQLPIVLVACKCDQHPAHRHVDTAVIEQRAKTFIDGLCAFQTSESAPETHRACLSVIARAAIAAKRPRSQASSMARRRANSSAVKSITQKDLWARKHERASSEISMRFQRQSSEVKSDRYKPSDTNKTFFNAEESPGYDSQDSDDQDSDAGQSIMSVKPSDENGYTFEQLVDRLLAQPMSKNDSKFVSVFLALYRRFATPGQLLEAIIKRFEAINKEKDLPMIRIISQLRYLAILQQWVAYYPGDFAYPTTRRLIRRFATSLASNREFSVAATEIIRDLEMVVEDDDTDWACSDRQRAQNENIPTFHNNVLDEDSDEDEFSRALGHMTGPSARNSVARSSVTGGTPSLDGSMGSSQILLTQVEKNERLARQLEPNPIKPLSKIQWHQLMGESEEAIAREMTRIDWIMFSSVRPRDLVRHVSLNAEEKKRCKNLENVTRMTDHFNHVAFLVSNYILLRDKPKHRALMMEKWMKIARQLRKLNDYNMLGAVLAGIKGTAVSRLIATRDLVPQPTTQDFWKLDILMNHSKSHGAYRLAWENSSGERIPYIPLHRRDLVSASEGNSTFVNDKKKTDSASSPHPGVSVFEGIAGKRDSKEAPPGGVTGKERINWRKFEIMGEVIVGVQRAQGTPYPNWQKCEEIRNLILDVKITKDEDDLFERSAHLEAQNANERGRLVRWFREPGRLSLASIPSLTSMSSLALPSPPSHTATSIRSHLHT